MKGFRFIDLFAGIGGFRKGFEAAGGRCVFTCEIDAKAREVYAANYEVDHPFAEDITEVAPADIPDHDLLLAGFPCQAFSLAGSRKGFEDTRGTLFFEIARLLEGCRTRAFILENVEGLLTHDGGETYRRIYRTLRDLGYHLGHRRINAAAWVPQNRKRIFIAGHLESVGFPSALDFAQFPPVEAGPRLGSILEPEPRPDAFAAERLGDREWAHIRRRADRGPETRRPLAVFGPDGVANTLPSTYRKGGGALLLIEPPPQAPPEASPLYAELAEVTLTDSQWRYIRLRAERGFFFNVFGPAEVGNSIIAAYGGTGGGRRLLIAAPADPFEAERLSDGTWAALQAHAARHREAGNGFGCSVFGADGVARTLSARYHKDGSEILIADPFAEVEVSDAFLEHEALQRDRRGYELNITGAEGVAGTLTTGYRGSGAAAVLIRRPRRNPRRLTARECSRLMGFDGPGESAFNIPVARTQAYRLFGNAVCPPVAQAIAEAVAPEI